ncbi:MAG: hypothetical protein WBN88_13675, partial [Anderseniella sp.]
MGEATNISAAQRVNARQSELNYIEPPPRPHSRCNTGYWLLTLQVTVAKLQHIQKKAIRSTLNIRFNGTVKANHVF